jgi:hypothetical protein
MMYFQFVALNIFFTWGALNLIPTGEHMMYYLSDAHTLKEKDPATIMDQTIR